MENLFIDLAIVLTSQFNNNSILELGWCGGSKIKLTLGHDM